MFTKSLVPQSLVDATKAIMEADHKKMLLEPELDETGFHKAAHAAKKANQSHFEFQGKRYPVTAKHHSEGMEPPEKIGGQILKKHDDKAAAKGHSAVVRPVQEEDDEKKSSNPFDVLKGKYKSQMAKKPGELTGHEHKKTSTGDVYTKKAMKEEDHPDEKEDKALVKKMVKKSALKGEETKETELSKHTVGEEKDWIKGAVKHPGAETAAAKKAGMSVQGYAEKHKHDSGKAGQRARFALTMKKMHEEGDCVTEPEAKKIADKEVGKHEKKMHHKGESVTEGRFNKPHSWAGVRTRNSYDSHGHSLAGGHDEGEPVYSKSHDSVRDQETKKSENKPKKQSMGENLSFKSFKEQLIERSHSEKQARTMAAAAHNPEFAKKVGIPQDVAKDFNKADKGTKMLSKAMSHKESIGGISTMSEDEHVRVDGETDMTTKTVDGLRGRMKVPADYHNKFKSYKVGLTVGEEAKSPMELAKELAHKSFKKIRNETMMGKLGTSEEKKHD